MSEGSFGNMEMTRFLEQLAATTPTPGGGTAAALSGAVAAALLEMAAGISARRKGADTRALQALCRTASQLRDRLVRAMDADADAYAAVSRALKLPKDTEAQSLIRRKAMQDALVHAAAVPLATAEDGLHLLKLSQELLPLCAAQLASDVSCAVRLAHACACAALDNVDANALSIRDERTLKDLGGRGAPLRQQAGRRTTALLDELEGILAGWRSGAPP